MFETNPLPMLMHVVTTKAPPLPPPDQDLVIPAVDVEVWTVETYLRKKLGFGAMLDKPAECLSWPALDRLAYVLRSSPHVVCHFMDDSKIKYTADEWEALAKLMSRIMRERADVPGPVKA